jgi:hypothetical protein
MNIVPWQGNRTDWCMKDSQPKAIDDLLRSSDPAFSSCISDSGTW